MHKKRHTRAGKAQPPNPKEFRPSAREDALFLKMGKVFARAQMSRTSHPNLMEKLMTMYEQLELPEFTLIFKACLRIPFKILEKNPGVDRTLEFAANFCIEVNKSEDKEETGDMCPFFVNVMSFLLDNSSANLPAVRFRICQMINLVMSNLGQNVELDEALADRIMASLIDRLKDKIPGVRSQAVFALQRLQDPGDPDCRVVKEFVYHMDFDPSPEVRSTIVQCIARSSITIPMIVKRSRDVKDIVRRNTLLVFAKIHLKSIKIVHREDVIKYGLQDRSSMVRECTKAILLPAWFSLVEKDFIKFLQCFDVSSTESSTKTCQLALDILMEREPLEEVMSYATKHLHNKMMPLKDLWLFRDNANQFAPEKVFFWTSLVKHLRKLGLEDDVESITPELTPFCQYVTQLVLEGDAPEEVDEFDDERRTFVIRQLMQMAGEYDLSDEMGRSTLCTLVERMIVSSNVSNAVTPELIELLVKIEPNVNARMQKLAELVSDIHVPLNAASQVAPVMEGDFKELTMKKAKLRVAIVEKATEQETAVESGEFRLADTLKNELVDLRLQLDQVNEALSTGDREAVRHESNDVDTLVQCLTVVYEMMQSPTVVTLGPQLRSLMQDFVFKFFENEPDIHVQVLCLKCLACFCLLDEELAKDKISVFFLQLADADENSEIGIISLRTIFDLFLYYGLGTFGIVDNLDITTAPKSGVKPYSDVIEIQSSSSDGVLSPPRNAETCVLKTMYNIFNDAECPLLHPVTAEGFCKLLLAGRINSFRLISRLVLAWYDSDSTKEMKDTIGAFFTLYSSNRTFALPLLVQTFLPTMDILLESSPDSTFANVDIKNVASFLISLTKPGINPDFKENVHDNLALVICVRILEDPSAELTIYLVQALAMLELTMESDALLQNVLDTARRVKKSLLSDKVMLKFLNKFIDSLEKLEDDREESLIDVSGATIATSVAGTVGSNDRTEPDIDVTGATSVAGTVESNEADISDATSLMDSINLADASTSTKKSLPSTRLTKSQAPALANIAEDPVEENPTESSSNSEDKIEILASSSPPRKKTRRATRATRANIVIPESQSTVDSDEDMDD